MIEYIYAAILGIVEGLTEFIPVSSTGHLIITSRLLGLQGVKIDAFEIFIQLGAIIAVVFLYWNKFTGLCDFKKKGGFAGINGLMLLGLTTIPALISGFFAHKFIKQDLFNVTTVAIGLGAGGIAILLVEWLLRRSGKEGLDSLTWRDALLIGLFQCLGLWPGVSRAAATIVGAIVIGISRRTAAEYSFLAAVPVIFAAAIYDLYKNINFLSVSDIPFFATGFIVSFVTAMFAVKLFLYIIGKTTLVPFGIYRLVVAVVILLLIK